jgi:hypothetical protein
MKVEYQIVADGTRDSFKKNAEYVPRIGESVLLIDDGEEREFTVKHVYHIYGRYAGEYQVQVVLG